MKLLLFYKTGAVKSLLLYKTEGEAGMKSLLVYKTGAVKSLLLCKKGTVKSLLFYKTVESQLLRSKHDGKVTQGVLYLPT